MPSPVAIKVSSEFAESARKAAETADRSLTGQIEHWAKLGRAAEEVMPAPVAAALKRCAGDLDAIEDASLRQRVLDGLRNFQTTSSEERRKLIGLDKMPVYEADPVDSKVVVRVAPDGSRTRGKMVGRKFIPWE